MLTVNPLFVLNSSLQLLFAVFWLQGWTTILGTCMQAKWMRCRGAPLELIGRGIGIFRLRFFVFLTATQKKKLPHLFSVANQKHRERPPVRKRRIA
jgi:hypothetical protein